MAKHSSDPQVAIVIPTIQSRIDLLKTCIIRALSFASSIPTQAIIVSKSGTFAHQCNIGARSAYPSCKYILFLNDDVEIRTDKYLSYLIKTSQLYDAAIVGSKLLYPNNTIQHLGVYFKHPSMLPYHPYLNEPISKLPDERLISLSGLVPAVTAAVMLVRKDVFDEIGGFDESFVNGFEDVDLCLKCLERGYKIALDTSSIIIHHEKQSRGSQSKEQIRDNIIKLTSKWPKNKIIDIVFNQHGFDYLKYSIPVPKSISGIHKQIINQHSATPKPQATKRTIVKVPAKQSSELKQPITTRTHKTASYLSQIVTNTKSPNIKKR